jgi:hypothetical protein
MKYKPDQQKSPSLREVASSVLAAAFGVQNRKNSERDFTKGNPVVFVIAGLIFTILFVMTIIGVVSLIIPT